MLRSQEFRTGASEDPSPQLTVAFQLILGIVAFVQFGSAVILLQFWPETFAGRVALWFRGGMGRGDAGAVRGTRGQRLAISQNVLN